MSGGPVIRPDVGSKCSVCGMIVLLEGARYSTYLPWCNPAPYSLLTSDHPLTSAVFLILRFYSPQNHKITQPCDLFRISEILEIKTVISHFSQSFSIALLQNSAYFATNCIMLQRMVLVQEVYHALCLIF